MMNELSALSDTIVFDIRRSVSDVSAFGAK